MAVLIADENNGTRSHKWKDEPAVDKRHMEAFARLFSSRYEQHAPTNEHESKQSSYAGKIEHKTLIGEKYRYSHQKTGDDGGERWCLVFRVDLLKGWR